MRHIKLTVHVSCAANEVFDYVLNPKNTPKWVSSIVQEKTNATPTRLGTIYKNQNREGAWTEYVISEYLAGKMFVMSRKDGSYNVKYTLTSTSDKQCTLAYDEWGEQSKLDEPFAQAMLQKLKAVIEVHRIKNSESSNP